MALAEAAHAVTVQEMGPRAPMSMAICAAAMLGIIMGSMNGLTRLGPRAPITRTPSSMVARPPRPEPNTTPTRSASAPTSSPLSATAWRAATTASWANRSMRRASLRPK